MKAQDACGSDIDSSGEVDVSDLLALLGSFGSSCINDASGNATPAAMSCDSITTDMECGDAECTAGGYNSECVENVGTLQSLWMDRDYAWTTTPGDLLDGSWTYIRAMLGVTGAGTLMMALTHAQKSAPPPTWKNE